MNPEEDGGHMMISPDGQYLAVDLPEKVLGPNDVWVLRVDGGAEIAVVSPGDDVVAGWSPDGREILFQTDRTGATELWSMPFASGKTGQPSPVNRSVNPRWSPIGVRGGDLYYFAAYPHWLFDVK